MKTLVRKTGEGLAIGGIVVGGLLGLVLLFLLVWVISTLFWAVLVFYGSMVVHWAFESVPSATFVQAIGIGFVISILRAIFGRGN